MPSLTRFAFLVAVAAATLAGDAPLDAAVHPAGVNEQLESARRLETEGKTDQAVEILTDILANAGHTDASFRAEVGADLARLHHMLGDYPEAMEAATTAAADAERADNRNAQSYAEFIVGMIHRDLNQLEAARNAFRASARLALDAGNTDQYFRSANEESNTMVLRGDLEGAVKHKLEVLKTAGEKADPSTLVSLENDVAFVYSRLERPADASPHFERAWELSLAEGQHRQAAIIACNLAGNIASLGKLDQAVAWAERSLAIAEANDLLPVQEMAHSTLGDLFFQLGQADRAVPHLQEAYILRGHILNESSASRIAELGTRHEAERREAEIELLRRDAEIRNLELAHTRNRHRLLVGGIMALAAFLAVLAVAYRLKVRANAEIRSANRDLELARQRVEELSRTDALTDLANRRALDEHLADEVLRSERSRRAFAVILVDIDRFKRINDSYGHEAGDQVLREVSRRLREGVREIDMIGRWGGEEFLVVLPDTDAEGGRRLAEKMRRSLAEKPMTITEGAIPVTATFGVAAYRENSAEDTVRRADEALYRGKHDGRNRVVVG